MIKNPTPFMGLLTMCETLINKIGKAVILVSVSVMFITLLMNIILRMLSIGQVISTYTSEIPALLLPWLIFGGAVIGAQYGAHLSIGILTSKFTDKKLTVLLTLRLLVILYVYGTLAWHTFDILPIVADEYSAILGVSNWYSYSCLFGGFVMICISEIIHYLRYFLQQQPMPSSLSGEGP